MGAPPGPSLLGNYKGPTVPFKGMPPMSNVPLSSSLGLHTVYDPEGRGHTKLSLGHTHSQSKERLASGGLR